MTRQRHAPAAARAALAAEQRRRRLAVLRTAETARSRGLRATPRAADMRLAQEATAPRPTQAEPLPDGSAGRM